MIESKRAVRNSEEFQRISRLPARDPETISELSALLARPQGAMTLRPIQAQALLEIGVHGGLFAPIGVGEGKTLITALAPYVLDAKRPVLVLPAKLVEKTYREFENLRPHWFIDYSTKIISYEWLSRVGASAFFEDYKPDLLIADECHRLKNLRAAVVKRVARVMKRAKKPAFVGLSGTITRRSIKDFAHLANWALGEGSPAPRNWNDVEEWGQALDEKVQTRLQPGPLIRFSALIEDAEKPSNSLALVRQGYQARLAKTPGVIVSRLTDFPCSLQIRLDYKQPIKAISELEDQVTNSWRLPDGHEFSDGMSLKRVLRQIALGFWYSWDPLPPAEWVEARSLWARTSRRILARGGLGLDSELQAAQYAMKGLAGKEAQENLKNWQSIRHIYTIEPKPVWVSENVIDYVKAWAKEGPGLIWSEHVALSKKLASLGLPYYGAQGKDEKTGKVAESEKGDRPIVLSVMSNAEGRNLQAFNRNLILGPLQSGSTMEQLLGRTHRTGQQQDEVTCDVLISCETHHNDWNQIKQDALYQEHVLGVKQRLNFADILD